MSHRNLAVNIGDRDFRYVSTTWVIQNLEILGLLWGSVVVMTAV